MLLWGKPFYRIKDISFYFGWHCGTFCIVESLALKKLLVSWSLWLHSTGDKEHRFLTLSLPCSSLHALLSLWCLVNSMTLRLIRWEQILLSLLQQNLGLVRSLLVVFQRMIPMQDQPIRCKVVPTT